MGVGRRSFKRKSKFATWRSWTNALDPTPGLYNHWLYAGQPEISPEAALHLLSALKALVKDMVFIRGSTYTLDSYRLACVAIAQAEKSATVKDLREPKLE